MTAVRPSAAPARLSALRRGGAFSLIELLVAMAVISLFAVMLVTVTDNTFNLWRRTQSDINAFESARAAFDVMTRRIAQATLNTYLDYYEIGQDGRWNRRIPGDRNFVPAKYGRASDLAFYSGPAQPLLGPAAQTHAIFFFAPLGFTNNDPAYSDLPNLLNAAGYSVEWGSDASFRPPFLAALPQRYRFRLIERLQPSQAFTYYPAFTDGNPNNDYPEDWIPATAAAPSAVRNVLAENIIALIIRPEVTLHDASLLGLSRPEDLTEDYIYDSRFDESREYFPQQLQFAQLPPLLRVVMVAVAERDAARLIGAGTTPPAAFQTGSGLFQNPSLLDADLKTLSDQLIAAKVQFRVFNQVIPVRGAKFSAQREN